MSEGSLIKGDSYTNAEDLIVYVYGTHHDSTSDTDVTGWHKVSDYTSTELTYEEKGFVLAKAMNDVLSNIERNSTLTGDYAYFNTVITNLITANYIATKELQLQSDGVISSSGISTDKSEDIDSQGFLTKNGFRLEDTGALRANQLYLGITTEDGNKIIFDSISVRCVNSSDTVLWELLPNGSANFNTEITANKLTAIGDNNQISATSLKADALETIKEVLGASLNSSSTDTFCSKDLASVSSAMSWIEGLFSANTIPTTESAFSSGGWTYKGKTIKHISLGNCFPITEQIDGEGTSGRSLVLGKKYYNSKTVSAGNSKYIIQRMKNNYSFPIWVYIDVNLDGINNTIYSFVHYEGENYYNNDEDEDCWICLMPTQETGTYASSSAWWGSRTANSTIYVYPTFKDLCFVYNPVEATALRNVKYTATSTSYTVKVVDIPLPTGHPSTVIVMLCGKTSGGVNLYDGGKGTIVYKAYNGNTDLGTCTHQLILSDHNAWKTYVSNIPATATKISLWLKDMYTIEEATVSGTATKQYIYSSITIKRLVYAVAYNDEAHKALIRYDDSSYCYLGSNHTYYEGLLKNSSHTEAFTRYQSNSVYNAIKAGLSLATGEYTITTDSTIIADGTTYTGMTKMKVTDSSVTFIGASQSLTIPKDGYSVTGGGTANTGGFIGTSFSSITGKIQIVGTQLGAKTATLYPKANMQYDLGKSNAYYRSAYIGTWIVAKDSSNALTFTYNG